MLANLQVSEPKPRSDDDSPLSFTMEGYKGLPPSAAIPFFWAPGWNSVQSVAKYQEEPGGPLTGGDPGVRLFRDKTEFNPSLFKDMPEAFRVREQKWLVLPQYHVLGSGELSSYTHALSELSPEPTVWLSEKDAGQLGVQKGEGLKLIVNGKGYILPVQVKEGLPAGLVLVSAGLPGVPALDWGSWIKLEKTT